MHQPVGELPHLRFEIIEAARILRMSRRRSTSALGQGRSRRRRMVAGGTSRPQSCSGTSWRRIVPSK